MDSIFGKRLSFSVVVVFVMVTAELTTAGATSFSPPAMRSENSFRRCNRNYSNACELLTKKRMAKVRHQKSKNKFPKWR